MTIASRHLTDLLGFDDVVVRGIADPMIERARSLADRCGAVPYEDHVRMVESEPLDALYICVPPFGHGAPESTASPPREHDPPLRAGSSPR